MSLPKNYSYRPLPRGFKIGKSEIEGQGLFTYVNLNKDVIIGKTHIKTDKELIRTPIGGFINCSEEPNCTLIERITNNFRTFYLKTIKQINKKEELTLDYNKSICGFN